MREEKGDENKAILAALPKTSSKFGSAKKVGGPDCGFPF